MALPDPENKIAVDLIFPKGPYQYRTLFAKYCRKLKLQAVGLRPYSIRRGGATFLFQASAPMAVTQERGQWTSQHTCRIYVTEARQQLQEMRLGASQVALLSKAVDVCILSTAG